MKIPSARSSRWQRWTLLQLLGMTGIVVLLASGPTAIACLNGVERYRVRAMAVVGEVEKLLTAGEAKRALTLLAKKFENEDGYVVSSPQLRTKIEELYAVARFRAGGKADVEAAIAVLRSRLKVDPKNPLLAGRLAEALSHTSSGMKESLAMLESLAKQDLIVDAEGFSTLARLRKQTGDITGAASALQRCKATAKHARLCSDTPLPPTSDAPQSPPARFSSEVEAVERVEFL